MFLVTTTLIKQLLHFKGKIGLKMAQKLAVENKTFNPLIFLLALEMFSIQKKHKPKLNKKKEKTNAFHLRSKIPFFL